MKTFLFSVLLLTLVGCASRSTHYDYQADRIRHRAVIVFVPGFYGTALADAQTGERYFLSAWKSLFSSVPLALTTPDLGIPGARVLRPDGVLESVPIIPGLYSVNAYGEALDFLRDTYGQTAEVIPFAYDWRKDVWQVTDDLDQLVQRLQTEGAARIVLIGHSMGGLVTAHYLRRFPKTPVRAAVIAAAPFGGVATAFRNLQIGTSVGAAKAPLTAMVLSTFPSMYYLMSAPDTQAYRDRRFQPIATNIYDPALWKRWHWGLYRETLPENSPLRARREEATARYLAQAEAAAKLLRTAPATRSEKPLLVYIGTGEETFARVQWSGASLNENGHWLFRQDSARQLAADASLFDDGDGTVPTFAATPPKTFTDGFRSQVIAAPATHAGMFGDEHFQSALKAFMRSAGM